MEKKLTSEEYKKHIDKLKKEKGVKRIVVPRGTQKDLERQLSIFFEPGTVLIGADEKIHVVKK